MGIVENIFHIDVAKQQLQDMKDSGVVRAPLPCGPVTLTSNWQSSDPSDARELRPSGASRQRFRDLDAALGIAGQIFVFFVMAVAAAEAAVGLAIVLAIYRHKETVDLRNINILKG